MSLPTQPPLEQAWQTLRASLEWTREFALVFVFTSNSTAREALFRRADDLMRAQVRPLERPAVKQAGDYLSILLPAAVQPVSAHAQTGMPLWLDLDGQLGDALWDEKRAEFLHRLNERRASLVHAGTRAVVLVLPQDWTKRAAEAAPDLWTIRQPTVFMELVGGQSAAADTSNARSVGGVDDVADVPKTASAELPLAVQRWQQAVAESPLAEHSLWDGTQASQAALEAGHTNLALEIARQTKAFAAEAVAKRGNTPERLRDLSISTDNLGGVAEALGQLEEAKRAYAEGERLSRALIADYGNTPERLRDLSISMEKLGGLAEALGQLEEAKSAYAEAESLRRALIADYGNTPERLRDLSISMEKLGGVAKALGQREEAKRAYADAEGLSRALIAGHGKTPERLRDLSFFMNKLGAAAEALGQLEEAKSAYAEGQALAQELIDSYGESVGALDVLAYNTYHLGQLEQARLLYQRLALAMPHEPRYRRALDKLGAAPAV
jgi:tetratricopeptide (TPR) repeat protein